MAGFQERIERYEEQRVKEVEEKKQRFAKERERKLPKLLDLLEKTRCKQLLTEIRNDVWKAGEVSVETPKDKIEAAVSLQYEWTEVGGGGGSFNFDGDYSCAPHHLKKVQAEITITATAGALKRGSEYLKISTDGGKGKDRYHPLPEYKGGPKTEYISGKDINETATKLERFLIKDTLERQQSNRVPLPYADYKQRQENKIVEFVLMGNLSPSEISDPSLLERAQTLRKQREQEVSKPEKSDRPGKKSLWDKIIGK